ncbi:ROK family protein [uncultured Sunxiuqinia sp.]|uniref:ROK family protein n=1 Tax=uncultured Sunxiuqinia sp. TaxID=1573825 RepID=UPI002AA696AC|nr:ROK family protein [uncultured Sunxiuqinia sp.]
MKYSKDKRIVATLDAGGTNFVFSAIQGNTGVVKPIRHETSPNNLEKCLNTIKEGFHSVFAKLEKLPVAISFAFPGPADYLNGIIGDLPNFPSFRGGVALGAMLEKEFNVPVFINNDGSLFAYGEALAGRLPEVNQKLIESGSIKQFKNLMGVTLGTGFGGGVVIDKRLLVGDNGCGGDVWVFRNKKYNECIVEESVSIRAVKRVYSELSGDTKSLSPEDIFLIAEGQKEGNKEAAIHSFRELGEMAGDAIGQANTLIDGLIVIGGGLSGAGKYIAPALVDELNSSIMMLDGQKFPRSQTRAYDLTDSVQFEMFLKGSSKEIVVPGTSKTVTYDAEKKTGVIISAIGASKAIALGAYAFALNQIDNQN